MAETAKMIRDFFWNLFRSRKLDELKAAHQRELDQLRHHVISSLESASIVLKNEREYFAKRVAELKEAHKKLKFESDTRNAELADRLAKVEKERDYFRGKCDRFELLLLTPRQSTPTVARRPGAPGPAIVGRKTWAQVQLEDLKRQEEEAAEIQRRTAKEKKPSDEGTAAEATGTTAEPSARVAGT